MKGDIDLTWQMKYHGSEYFVAVWCNEFFLAMQAACEHGK